MVFPSLERVRFIVKEPSGVRLTRIVRKNSFCTNVHSQVPPPTSLDFAVYDCFLNRLFRIVFSLGRGLPNMLAFIPHSDIGFDVGILGFPIVLDATKRYVLGPTFCNDQNLRSCGSTRTGLLTSTLDWGQVRNRIPLILSSLRYLRALQALERLHCAQCWGMRVCIVTARRMVEEGMLSYPVTRRIRSFQNI